MQQINNIIESIKYGPHIKTEMKGDVRYLKGNHFDIDSELTLFSDSYVEVDEADKKVMLEENDVILAAKGFRNFAWKYSSDFGACVASSLFYVIKLNQKIINADYFTMVINSPRVQHKLKNIGLGATIPSIPKNELLRIEIAVPTMDKQLKAVEIHNLVNKQIRIERDILKKRIEIKNELLNVLTEK